MTYNITLVELFWWDIKPYSTNQLYFDHFLCHLSGRGLVQWQGGVPEGAVH